ncbi:MAG: ABC transporter permease [Planctomycetota bacterium]|nr:ABC transporter permease [Planctomycetota bacterium]
MTALPGDAARRSGLRDFPYWHELVLVALLTALMLGARWQAPDFVTWETQLDLSTHIWELALMCLPMTLIIITAGIDLSVGSIMALSAVILGTAYLHWDLPIALAAALALLTGAAAGALNGVFVAWVRVHPLIVTLAALAAYYGTAVGISHGMPLSNYPESFRMIGGGSVCGLPIAGLIFAAAALVSAVVLGKTAFGLALYAIGHNETAVRFSGIPVDRIKLLLYTCSGLAASLAALLFVGRRNTANTDIGAGISLDVITAVVLGGTSIFGGRGRIVGTLLGIVLIHETREFVSWHWSKAELNLVVIGSLLIVSVLLNSLLSARRRGD